MSAIPVSVVVVSRGRPEALKRCLMGISQLVYGAFEIVVVTDREGQDAVAKHPFAEQIKIAPYERPNISGARNHGIAMAAGEVVAFIDDDAVPEPGWLHHLIAPFAEAEVAAAGGFVRGRNGISMQWRARQVDYTGVASPLALEGERSVVLHGRAGHAIKTEGTNMAVRRDVLAELGGFDTAYRFFLDETDLNMRLAQRGLATAIVPLAEVHHGFEANVQRNAGRVPRDLSEIGASLAVYLRKYCPESERAGVWKAFRTEQRQRMLRHMVRGDAMPGDVGRLMRGLSRGYKDGLAREFGSLAQIVRAADGFRRVDVTAGAGVVVAGRRWRKVEAEAVRLVGDGKVPSVFQFRPNARYHRVKYDPRGFWVQRGGLFGRSERAGRLVRLTRFSSRVKREVQRVAKVRFLGD
ncbi:glycosyltransferase family 2 protein [Shimia abyssi]|uniref:Glycosyl transferase family 2 n=1 Tax=Shimia abyssi TaxID=1662395 RepID=A0A2P8F8I8_9RHOB|nr:glycosyltransferase [Shimia abyssi]PSL18018.1 glycosyl transferase family 2 [Shimia abyssi]